MQKKMLVIAYRNFQQNFTPMVIVLEPVRDSGVHSEVWQLSRQGVQLLHRASAEQSKYDSCLEHWTQEKGFHGESMLKG